MKEIETLLADAFGMELTSVVTEDVSISITSRSGPFNEGHRCMLPAVLDRYFEKSEYKSATAAIFDNCAIYIRVFKEHPQYSGSVGYDYESCTSNLSVWNHTTNPPTLIYKSGESEILKYRTLENSILDYADDHYDKLGVGHLLPLDVLEECAWVFPDISWTYNDVVSYSYHRL